MTDRDELEAALWQATGRAGVGDPVSFYMLDLLDAIEAAGWRPTVTLPEEVSKGRLRTCPARPGHAPFLAIFARPWCTITRLRADRPEQGDGK